jgi:hypothetical protein
LETDGSRSPKGGSYDELQLNLAVKSEALRAAKQTEEDFREQIVSRKCLGILTSQI